MNRKDFVMRVMAMPTFTMPPTDITFSNGNGGAILTLTADGQIKVGPHVTPDEAARRFLEVLAKLYPSWICEPKR